MTEFEKYLIEHKDQLNWGEPSNKVWERIEINLDKSKPRFFKVAAAILLVATFSGAFGYYISHLKEKVFLEKIAQLYPEYPEAERYLVAQFDLKYQEIEKSQFLTLIQEDLHQIDVEIESLKRELISAPYEIQENIISNLIKAYQAKLQLLDLILQSSKNNKSHENPFAI
jgi:hypothetical protein